jgi:hypothetical protein
MSGYQNARASRDAPAATQSSARAIIGSPAAKIIIFPLIQKQKSSRDR